MSQVLVIGGAGFIGSFIVDKLIAQGHSVRIFDNFESQVHQGTTPPYLNSQAELVSGDVRDEHALFRALQDIDVVFHQGAMVGVGQSMYQIKRYMDVNTVGTANLLDILVNKKHNVRKLIVAASMSSYGEGLYLCNQCGQIEPPLRTEEQMKSGHWEVRCPSCREDLKPIPTPETKRQDANSIYALSKMDQEIMCMLVGKAYGIPSVALRYFNVFGPRQSLSNPYTGVAAIFMCRIKNDNQPVIYEDGLQTRDFVSVHDIVQANMLAMEKTNADYQSFNVGSGNPISIKQVAEKLAAFYGKDIKPQITHQFRKGDVRNCFADITKIKKLGYKPSISFEEGIKELAHWSHGQHATDSFELASKELKERKLA